MTFHLLLPWALLLLFISTALLFFFRKKKPETDQSFSLLQQHIISLQEQLRISLEGTHKTVGERLDNVSQTVGQRLDNAARVVRDLDQRMGKVEEATKRVFEVGQDIASLQEILRAPKLRGNLGEQFLGDLLAQMLPQDAYVLQHTFKDGERVDALIRTAHGFVPVDAKFPLENFQRLLSVTTDDERTYYRKLFLTDVKKHINDIAKKYIRPGEGTFDFALMYIPAENVYYEMVTRDEMLGESESLTSCAMKKKVIPVSPNTFYAYLNTILLGLRGLRVEKFAKEIEKGLGDVRKQVKTFAEDFEKVGKHLGNATTAFGNAEKRLTRLDDRLAQFESSEGALALLPKEEEEGSGLYLNS